MTLHAAVRFHRIVETYVVSRVTVGRIDAAAGRPRLGGVEAINVVRRATMEALALATSLL